MKILFAGTPEFAAKTLKALISSRHHIAMVLTQPDRPAGRGMQAKPAAVKRLALENGLAIRQPPTLRDEIEQKELAMLGVDVMVVVAYGLILPQQVLDIPRLGAINIHASLLPRWRGAAPIQRALLAGDTETGVSIMRMDAGLDTGPIYKMDTTPITDADNAQSLHDRIAEMGTRSLLQVLDELELGEITPSAQRELGALYAAKISKEEALIDWQRSAIDVGRQIRAFNPNPGAVARLGQAEIKIWQARVAPEANGRCGEILRADSSGLQVACAQQGIWVDQLQRAGGKRLGFQEFLRGFPLNPGQNFTSSTTSTTPSA
ncbi:MAG: methionyl-tRNA formyltransferase [Burkholderiales bacterium]